MSTEVGPVVGVSAHRIPNLPSSFYYVPNFISPAEEQYILQKAGTGPQLKSTSPTNKL